jgi:hypothetical protein
MTDGKGTLPTSSMTCPRRRKPTWLELRPTRRWREPDSNFQSRVQPGFGTRLAHPAVASCSTSWNCSSRSWS